MEPHSEEVFIPNADIRLPGTRLGRLLERLAQEQETRPDVASDIALVFEGEKTIRVSGGKS